MMDYEEEEQHEEVQAELQAEAMEIDEDDAPNLDLRDARERQGYTIIKNQSFVHIRADEDITPMDTNNTPQVDVQGPITRARARQLNLQVSSFLSTYSCEFENRLLSNDLIILSNKGEDLEKALGRGGSARTWRRPWGVEDQQGHLDQGGGPNRFDFVSVSDSRNSLR
jgi:hypothetical protein